MSVSVLEPTGTAKPEALAYSLAIGAVGCAFAVRLSLMPVLEMDAPFLMFVAAVLVSAWYGGLGPGLVATGLSAVAGSFTFLPPLYDLRLEKPSDYYHVILFVSIGALVCLLIAAVRSREKSLKRGQEALRASEDQFRLLVDGAVDYSIAMIDENGIIRTWNSGAQRLFGYSEREILGEHFSLFFTDKDRESDKPQSVLLEARNSGLWQREGWSVKKDGSMFMADVKIKSIYKQYELAGFGLVTRDISERRLSDENRLVSEQRFQLLVEGTQHIAIFMTDPSGTVISWNAGVKAVLGYDEHEFVGMPIVRIFTPDESAEFQAQRERKVAAEEGSARDTRWHVKKNGTKFWAIGTASAIYDAHGKVLGFAKIISDATAEKLAQVQLKESEERLRSIIDNVIDGIVTISEEGVIETFNAAAETLFGYEADEIIRRNVTTLMPEHYADQHQRDFFRNLGSDARKMVGQGREVLGKRKDGTVFPMDLAVGEFIYQGQRKFTGIIRDISDRKRTEGELLEARRAADAANSAKSAFIANMSHEIRTPLGAVLGFSELLVLDDVPPESRGFVDAIIRNAKQLGSLIDDILDLSKIEAGKVEVEVTAFSLSELVADVVKMLKGRAGEKGIELSSALLEGVPRTVYSDQKRLRQILLNIVGNAIKFTDEGEVTIHVSLGPNLSQKKVCLQFLVIDTGMGLTSEQIQRLFQPFVQADSSMSRKFGGTGLGLVLSRSLAQILNGDVRLLSSVPGKGSTFLIEVESAVEPDQRLDTASDHLAPRCIAPSITATNAVGSPLDNVSALVVDDNPDILRLTRMILERAGARISVADNGRTAIAAALKENVDVVLMDIQMPEMDGYQAVKELRRQAYKKPIIALTAHATREERERTLACGFNNFLTKPLNFEKLIALVAKYGTDKNSPPS